MILWNRNDSYNRLKTQDREDVIKRVASQSTIKRAAAFNLLLNIAVCVATLLFCNNIILAAVIFVLFDAILRVADHLIFFAIPYRRTINISLNGAQKRLEKVKKVYETKKARLAQKTGCNGNCHDCWSANCNEYELDELKLLLRFINSEQEYIDEQLEKIAESAKKQEVIQQSKGYIDRKESFNNTVSNLNNFINNQNMMFLEPVKTSVDELQKTLAEKPVGWPLVPEMIYVYLDELNGILAKLVDLDEEKRKDYITDVEKIIKALDEKISDLNDRIVRIETDDIEIGIAVLLKELTDIGGNNV